MQSQRQRAEQHHNDNHDNNNQQLNHYRTYDHNAANSTSE